MAQARNGRPQRGSGGRITHRHTRRFDAVLVDRDGTLIPDVPYNGDPDLVTPMPGARRALDRLRAAGLKLGVVSNQSGVGLGLFTMAQLAAVNARVAELLGPFDTWQICPHVPEDRCGCRKPNPGMIFVAAADLGTEPSRCVMLGDIVADVFAAQTAGATGILIPTEHAPQADLDKAPLVCRNLNEAADWILGTAGDPAPPKLDVAQRTGNRVLVVRPDSDGDVLLTSPAIRAIAARAAHVSLWCGPRGRAAAELLPGLDELIERHVPWIEHEPQPVLAPEIQELVARLRSSRFDEAIVFTSPFQSPLPTALLLRLAGIGRISDDYPGALLDVRHRVPGGIPEAERAVSLAAAAGYPLPPDDDGRLRVAAALPDVTSLTGGGDYIVVHPGATVPARACPPATCARFTHALATAGYRVLVTGAAAETALTDVVAAPGGAAYPGLVLDLGGRTSLLELAAVLDGARCVVVGNTGPAHLAAAVGTPMVSLFSPVAPFAQWRPYDVPHVRLGKRTAGCEGGRAVLCPVPGHPCLSSIDPAEVVAAVASLTVDFPEEVTVR